MNSFFQESLFAGLALSLVAYVIGMALKKKLKIGIFHPLLISIIISIAVLAIGSISGKCQVSKLSFDTGNSLPCNSLI